MADEDDRRWDAPPVAVFWDQSLLWGLICVETLRTIGVPCRLLSGAEIAGGGLDGYRTLVVPGGWASHKMRALGRAGKEAVRRFVESGGSYLGFCGGAGLALSSPPSLGLVPLKRMVLSERLPSASGGVRLRGTPEHPAWRGIPESLIVPIWWPSQFEPRPQSGGMRCLATYDGTGPDFRVADLPASDLEEHPIAWEVWESVYGINLDPKRLLGQPAIVEGRFGHGTVILSYPHMETPGECDANRLFMNTLRYLDERAGRRLPEPQRSGSGGTGEGGEPGGRLGPLSEETAARLARMRTYTEDIISFGERHLLWNWRLPWLLHWKRGIRGLEYGTMAVAVRFLAEQAGAAKQAEEATLAGEARRAAEGASGARGFPSGVSWENGLRELEESLADFHVQAKRLLIEEKLATQTGHLTKLGSVNESVDRLRIALFGNSMNHGGLCRTIFDRLDPILLAFLRAGR